MKLMFDEVRNNKIKSVTTMLVFVVIILALGYGIGFIYGSFHLGLGLALVFSLVYLLIGYYSGDKIVLKTTGARPVTKKEFPYLFHTIEGLAMAAGIPKPKAYVIEDKALNAFATGRDPKHASITVTTGLLNKLNRQELEGVIAHEMSHVKNYDIRFMMLAAVLLGITILLSDMFLRSMIFGRRDSRDSGQVGAILVVVGLVLAILSPIIGEMIKLAISRKREYMADANAAVLTRYPPGLANALRKISEDSDPMIKKANKSTAHLFISNPFRKKKGFVTHLFSTHPPIKERIKRLEAM